MAAAAGEPSLFQQIIGIIGDITGIAGSMDTARLNSAQEIQGRLDGLKNAGEVNYFQQNFIDKLSLNSEASEKLISDVSADNFKYYLGGDLDASDKKILERYKNFNGMVRMGLPKIYKRGLIAWKIF